MKKSLNLVFLICLFFNVATVGQIIDQRNHFLAVEYHNVSSNHLIRSIDTKESISDKKVKKVTTEKFKQHVGLQSNLSQDFTWLLDEKPSLERAVSLRGALQNSTKPVHAIDYQNHELKTLDLRIATPPIFRINRESKSFGPIYNF